MRVNEDVLKCVVFICVPKKLVDGSSGVSFIGTGFFVSIPSKKDKNIKYIYLVTAKHVAKRLENTRFFVRINTNEGSFGYVPAEHVQWFYHPADDSTDVAVIPYAPPKKFDVAAVSTNMFLKDEVLDQKKIGLGDDVFITGLFAHECGSRRNQPIIRIGNLAMIPDEPLHSVEGNMEAYLIEARSIGGLSGSPAFIAESKIVNRKIYLLGLMHGHWDIHPEMKNEFDTTNEIRGKVNMGIAIVIPAKKILEVLNHPKLVEARQIQEEQL